MPAMRWVLLLPLLWVRRKLKLVKLVRAHALSFGPATLVSATRLCAPTVTTTGVGEEICCAFCVHSAVVNFWNQKPSDAALESSRWEELSYRFCFFIFPFCGFILRKNIFARCFAWCKKTISVTVFGPVIEKIRENTRDLLDDGCNFNFYPKEEKPRFLSFSGCSAEGAPIERFVLASASHWCAGCWGFLHTIFSRLELFLLPL